VKKSNKSRYSLSQVGKMLFDLAKLTFGSLVLGTTIKGAVNQYLLFLIGVIITVSFGAIGIIIMTNTKEDE